MSRNPIAKKPSITPTVTFQLLEPSQASAPAPNKKTGQGVASNSCSNRAKKNNSGSNIFSIISPNSLVKSLKAESTHIREFIITSRGIDIALLTNKEKSDTLIASLT